MKYKRVLVANRGEIAVRILRALKELNIYSVSVYSESDKDMLHTKLADESVCIGSGLSEESYLNTYNILAVATIKKVDAIHPGIGFFAENANFSDMCSLSNIDFIGPNSKILDEMGNKRNAKLVAAKYGVPVIPGSESYVSSVDECYSVIKDIKFPVILKAANGGGGKGIRKISNKEEIERNFKLCKKEALSAFSNDDLLIEKCLDGIRHVEVQIIGDKYGNIIHLGDRECTIQRNKQKIIEEAPCVNISNKLREKLYEDAIKIAKGIDYVGPGTIEFLILSNESYYFLEMNTRLQVEHTVTELITGVDIVKEQIRVVGGEKLSLRQQDIRISGYAMQCRILAENVLESFTPSLGKILEWNMPGGFGVRVDGGYKLGDVVSPYYDSLLTKICCVGENKEAVVKKMKIALAETNIAGICTNQDFLSFLIGKEEFSAGKYDDTFVQSIIGEYNVSANNHN